MQTGDPTCAQCGQAIGPLYSGDFGCVNRGCRAVLERALSLPDEPTEKENTLQLLLAALVDATCERYAPGHPNARRLRKLFELLQEPAPLLPLSAEQLAYGQQVAARMREVPQPSKAPTAGVWCPSCDAPMWPLAGNIACEAGKCARNSATTPLSRLETSFKAIGLLQLAQGLVMRARGATQLWPMESEKAAVAYLRKRLSEWRESALPKRVGYDESVHRLVEAALQEHAQAWARAGSPPEAV